MPKFTFPVPGRRQKAPPPPPIVSAPLTTKAQKFLGASELNIDSPTLPKDQSRAWDARSTGGISISISESTTSHDDRDAGLGVLTEGKVVNGASPRLGNFDQESGILPPEILHNGRPLHGRAAGLPAIASDVRSITDASSLRRRQSTSTIVSYYDSTKVPLAISQQTANSAIAKGLPPKASALLDIGGPMTASAPKEKKKKPAKLDFSHLLPRSRSSNNTSKNMVLGADLMTRSPSVLSISPEVSGPPTPPAVVERRPRRKLTKESLREVQAGGGPTSPPMRSRKAAEMYEEAAVLELSERYSRNNLRDMHVSHRVPVEAATVDQSPTYGSSPHSSSTRGYLSPFPSGPGRAQYLVKKSSANDLSGTETPITAIMSPPSVQSPTDCSASISSRHTRTSKASKRTDRSMTEFDLQQNSVLSLSSDSEDDYVAQQQPGGRKGSLASTGGPRSPTEAMTQQRDYQSPPRSRSSSSANQSLKRPGTASTTSNNNNQFLTIPENHATTTSRSPPSISTRTSSLSSALTSSTPSRKMSQTSGRSSSGVSMNSISTANSTGINGGSANDYAAVHEARAITMVPALGARYGTRDRDSTDNLSSGSAALSPSSVDFYMHSRHSSVQDNHNDRSSVRSSRSLSAMSNRGSVGANAAAAANNGRFMAVTRQEEMLLAALRMKRARMRENIIAEFEEEQEQQEQHETAAAEQHMPRSRSRQVSQRSSADTITDQQPRRTSQKAERKASKSSLSALATANSDLSALINGHGGGSAGSDKGERILMCLDKPVLSAYDAAEPSPDLSDFMDYDDTNSSDSYPFHTPDYSPLETASYPEQQLLGPRPVPRPRPAARREGSRHRQQQRDSMLVHVPAGETPRGKTKAASSRRPDDVHVRIVEDPVEIPAGRGLMRDDDLGGIPEGEEEVDVPRPDSPSVGISLSMAHQHHTGSPETPLPRKKAVRISAVGMGRPGADGAGWWGHDG